MKRLRYLACALQCLAWGCRHEPRLVVVPGPCCSLCSLRPAIPATRRRSRMKISRKLLIPVIALATSAVTPAAALATTSSPAITSRAAVPARTASPDSSALQLRTAAADVAAGFRMPRSAAADMAVTSVPAGPSPEIVPDGTVPADAAASEFTDCAAEKYDGFCLWQNTGYKGDFWYFTANGWLLPQQLALRRWPH